MISINFCTNSSCLVGKTCEYVSRVNSIVQCPKSSEITLTLKKVNFSSVASISQ
jgi:hypothetical protein